jgi:hypothetical protein
MFGYFRLCTDQYPICSVCSILKYGSVATVTMKLRILIEQRVRGYFVFWEFRLCVPTNIQLAMLAPLRVMIGGDGVSHSVFNGMNRSTTYAMNPFLKNESSS